MTIKSEQNIWMSHPLRVNELVPTGPKLLRITIIISSRLHQASQWNRQLYPTAGAFYERIKNARKTDNLSGKRSMVRAIYEAKERVARHSQKCLKVKGTVKSLNYWQNINRRFVTKSSLICHHLKSLSTWGRTHVSKKNISFSPLSRQPWPPPSPVWYL